MIRAVALATSLLTSITVAPALAADDYVVVLQILDAKGTYSEMVVAKSTPAPVGYDECSLRRDAYWREDGPMWEASLAQVHSEGNQAEINAVCKRLAEVKN